MLFDPQKEQRNIQPFSRNFQIFQFQIFFKMATAGRMIGLSNIFIKVYMLNRVWNLSPRNGFAEKLTGGAFFNFPRFAAAHCIL